MRSSLDVAISLGVAGVVSAYLIVIIALALRDAWLRFRGNIL